MRRITGATLCIFFFIIQLISQTIIENPEKPPAKNAGRAVRLEEVLRIEDAGDAFFFQMPYNLKVGPGGTILVQDTGQLLQFDQDGDFIRNFFKKGQGPGEVSSIRNYCFEGNELVVHCPSPNKIVWFDADGELVKEFRIEYPTAGLQFLSYSQGIYYFDQFEFPRDRGEPQIKDIPHTLYKQKEDDGDLVRLEEFPVSYYVVWAKGGGGAVIPMNRLICAPAGENYVFFNHRPEYQIKMFDLERGEIVRVISRPYERQRTPADYHGMRGPIIDGEVVVPPRPRFLNDIENIFKHRDTIWVMTSTVDKSKGTLFDIFEFDGRYIDNFYLQIPENVAPAAYRFEPLTVSGDFFYIIEKTEDETFVIKKYKILGL